jgi:glycosyltransferase involved in cell wall biosynthesis
MKIVHVIPSFGLGGMEKVISSLINSTSHKYNHHLLILDGLTDAYQWIKTDQVKGIPFFKNGSHAEYLKQLYKSIKYASPSLLMTYNWGATDAIWLGRLAGVDKIIHSEHGFNIDETRKTLLTRDICRFIVYRLASKVITVSHQLKSFIRRRYYLSDRTIEIVSNGVDTNLYFPDMDERAKIRRRLGFADGDFVIIFSGRLDPVKNLDLLLDIFDYCRSIDTRIKLLIVGDGPERVRLEKICRTKNISKHVIMTGATTEVLPYLRAADVFLLTSFREQMPLTILEAMAVGLPIVASNVGEIPNIVGHGREGFLSNIAQGRENFSLALLSLRDSAKLKTMAAAARAKIVAAFQERTMVTRYQALIENICCKV